VGDPEWGRDRYRDFPTGWHPRNRQRSRPTGALGLWLQEGAAEFSHWLSPIYFIWSKASVAKRKRELARLTAWRQSRHQLVEQPVLQHNLPKDLGPEQGDAGRQPVMV
jgi:hypothetical protein